MSTKTDDRRGEVVEPAEFLHYRYDMITTFSAEDQSGSMVLHLLQLGYLFRSNAN